MHNQLAKAIGCRTLRVLSHTGLTEVFISVSVATFLQRGSSVAAIVLICSGMSLHVIHGHIPTRVSFVLSHAVGVVPSRTHTALNHIGLAAVSFRLVFTLFNAHSICWRRRWCLLGRVIQVNCPCSDRGAWNVACISHCLASFSPSGGKLVGDKCSRIVQFVSKYTFMLLASSPRTVASTTSHVRCNTMRYHGQLSGADQVCE